MDLNCCIKLTWLISEHKFTHFKKLISILKTPIPQVLPKKTWFRSFWFTDFNYFKKHISIISKNNFTRFIKHILLIWKKFWNSLFHMFEITSFQIWNNWFHVFHTEKMWHVYLKGFHSSWKFGSIYFRKLISLT